MKKKIYIYTAGAALCTLLFCISMFQVISHYASAGKSTNEFAQLAEIVEQAEEAEENGEIRIDKIIIGKSEGQDIADMEMPENSAEDAGELAEAFAKALGTYADYIKVTVLPAEAERG